MSAEFKKYRRILKNGTEDTVLVSIELNAVVAHSINGSKELYPVDDGPLPFNIQPGYVPHEDDIPYIEIPVND